MAILKFDLLENIGRIVVVNLGKVLIIVILFLKGLKKFVSRSIELCIAIFKQREKLFLFVQIRAENRMINIVLCNYFKFLLRHNRRRNLADDTLAIVNFAHNTDNGCHEEHTVVYQSNFVRIGSIISLFDMICPKFIKSLNFQKVTKEATVVFFKEQL